MKQSSQFAGAVVTGWRAYNITSDKTYGIGAWSDRQLADYIQTGHAEGRGSAAGPMGEAVANSLQYLTPEDTAALVSYLRKVPPQAGEPDAEVAATTPAMSASTGWAPGHPDIDGNAAGLRIFEGACASCHQWNGAGQQTPYAALAGSRTVNDPTGTNLVQVLLAGADLRAVHATIFMPNFGKAYSDAELAAVSNYVLDHFGGKNAHVTAEAVHRGREGH
jgi:mono/diheme cytochrome c family protein